VDWSRVDPGTSIARGDSPVGLMLSEQKNPMAPLWSDQYARRDPQASCGCADPVMPADAVVEPDW
jgi:hypothetical protein